MKYLISFFTMVLIAWPSIALGYIYAAIKTGFIVGKYSFGKHCDETSEALRKHREGLTK